MRHARSWFIGWALAVGLASGLATEAGAQASSDHAARLQARVALARPAGDGPFPAVVLAPGCQGFDHAQYRGRYERFTRDLLALGFVTARADYLTAAEAGTCDLVMDPAGAASDILAVAAHLKAQPFVKADAINVVGWSYGAGLSLGMLHAVSGGPPFPVAAVVAYMPYLSLPRPWSVDLPVLVMCTLQDTVAPCDRIEAFLGEVGNRQSVRLVKFPEGLHGFDNADLPPGITASGNRSGYHAATAAAAWDEVKKFLRR